MGAILIMVSAGIGLLIVIGIVSWFVVAEILDDHKKAARKKAKG